jgi:hypothetical protein
MEVTVIEGTPILMFSARTLGAAQRKNVIVRKSFDSSEVGVIFASCKLPERVRDVNLRRQPEDLPFRKGPQCEILRLRSE